MASHKRIEAVVHKGNLADRPSVNLQTLTGVFWLDESNLLYFCTGAAWEEVYGTAGTQISLSDLPASLAGAGLTGSNGSALAVNPDNSSLEIATDTLQVKALGVTSAMLAGSIAYSKLSLSAALLMADLATSLRGTADGLGIFKVCRATFDPSNVVGDRSQAAHAEGTAIPSGAIIVGGFLETIVALDSSDHTGSVAVSVESANDIVSVAAINGAPWSTTGRKAIVPKANTPESTSIKTTQARQVTFTVTTKDLTVGTAIARIYYLE